MKLEHVVTTPIYETVVPSTKKKTKFRPFIVKEERALLAAHESEDVSVMIHTLNQVIKNCLIPSPEFLTTFDLEYLFTQIRTKSVGEISTFNLSCSSCSETCEVNVDLTEVKVSENPTHQNKIKISDTIVIKMKYPSVEELIDIEAITNKEEATFRAICAAVDTIFVGDEAINSKDETPDAIIKFVNSLTSKQYKPLEAFFDTMPKVVLDVKFVCTHCKADNTRTLEGLNNFFS